MKKILYLITLPEEGGAQVYVADLAKRVQGEFDVTVASSGYADDWLPTRLRESNIAWHRLHYVKRSLDPVADVRAVKEIRQLVQDVKPDIIHLNSSKISVLGSLATMGLPHIKSVYTAHGWVFLEPLKQWEKLLYLWAEKFTSYFKDQIICVSEYDRSAARLTNFPMDKLITIHNGIDTSVPSLSREEARKWLLSRTQREDAGKIYGSIANLYPTKNLPALITAASEIVKTDPACCFIIIGAGPLKPELEERITREKLNDHFFLVGNIKNARQYLAGFDMFILPSVKEGLPYTLLEAMNQGLPIVATRVGGIFEMLEFYPQTHYRLVPPADDHKLLTAITELSDQSPLPNTDLLRIRQEISVERMVDKTKEIYLK